MRSAGNWSAIMIMVSFGAFGVTVINAYPRYLKTVPDAMAWDVLVSTVFLGRAATAGLFAAW